MCLNSKFKLLAAAVTATCFLFNFGFVIACQATGTAVSEEPVAAAVQETEETEEKMVEEDMKIESPAFGTNESIPLKYTCDGENVNPQLNISGVPADAKSLVLIVDDPDAPGKTWVHWIVWNIDPGTDEISENSVPAEAIEGVTDFGMPGYGGPCPPSGTHRYFFKVYALDTTLGLDSSATINDLEEAMKDHILRSTELVGLYKRS